MPSQGTFRFWKSDLQGGWGEKSWRSRFREVSLKGQREHYRQRVVGHSKKKGGKIRPAGGNQGEFRRESWGFDDMKRLGGGREV